MKQMKLLRQFRNEAGQWHREDGPALIYNCAEYWYHNGLLHRLDGPACVCDNGVIRSKFWYMYGLKHRDDGSQERVLSEYPTREYGPSAPSSIWYNRRSKRMTKEYHYYGLLHNESGPASIIEQEGKIINYSYSRYGVRFNNQGPAFNYTVKGESQQTKHQFCLYGRCVSVDEYMTEHMNDYGPQIHYQRHDNNGLLHSTDGTGYPALVVSVPTGKETRELRRFWFKHGMRHSDGGPAMVTPYSETWYRDAKMHRDDGPASISRHTIDKGEVVNRYWYKDGKLHRIDGPAVENFLNGKGNKAHTHWFIDGAPLSQQQAEAHKARYFLNN